MLQIPSSEVCNIYAFADDCKNKAESASSNEQRELLTLQQSLTNLADHYENAERLFGLQRTNYRLLQFD